MPPKSDRYLAFRVSSAKIANINLVERFQSAMLRCDLGEAEALRDHEVPPCDRFLGKLKGLLY